MKINIDSTFGGDNLDKKQSYWIRKINNQQFISSIAENLSAIFTDRKFDKSDKSDWCGASGTNGWVNAIEAAETIFGTNHFSTWYKSQEWNVSDLIDTYIIACAIECGIITRL